MPATIAAPEEAVRPRGSSQLLACWGATARAGEPLDGIAEALSAIGQLDELDGWARTLRRHGGRPRPPRAITDGVPLPELVRSADRVDARAGAARA